MLLQQYFTHHWSNALTSLNLLVVLTYWWQSPATERCANFCRNFIALSRNEPSCRALVITSSCCSVTVKPALILSSKDCLSTIHESGSSRRILATAAWWCKITLLAAFVFANLSRSEDLPTIILTFSLYCPLHSPYSAFWTFLLSKATWIVL